jgi:AcrR family transcriptional regulator
MSPRRYTMDKRAQTAEETRRRIVEATYALHQEQGIAETTMKQIAERADVGLGTVYHHFPTYDDAVRACGAHTFAISSPPDTTIFAGAKSLDERIARLAEALFAFYARCPGIGKARADQARIAALNEAMAHWDAHFAELVAAALKPADGAEALAPVLTALLDFDVHARLIAAGFSTESAASLIARMVACWIKERRSTQPTGKPRRSK